MLHDEDKGIAIPRDYLYYKNNFLLQFVTTRSVYPYEPYDTTMKRNGIKLLMVILITIFPIVLLLEYFHLYATVDAFCDIDIAIVHSKLLILVYRHEVSLV